MRRCEAQWLTVPGSMACGGRGFLWQRWKVATNDFCNIYLVYDWLLTGPCVTHSQGSDFSKQRRMIESEELKLKIHLKRNLLVLYLSLIGKCIKSDVCCLSMSDPQPWQQAPLRRGTERKLVKHPMFYIHSCHWSLFTVQCAPFIRSVCITHQVCMCTGGAWSNIKYLNITILADLWERAV